VLVRFVFPDESGEKRRPAVVLSTEDYHRSRQEVVIAAITSNVERLLAGDHRIVGWQEAGLLFPSVATGVLRTIKQSLIERRLGSLAPVDLQAIRTGLAQALGL
jgi:mRNA interferase MazF